MMTKWDVYWTAKNRGETKVTVEARTVDDAAAIVESMICTAKGAYVCKVYSSKRR